jgi:hypothetical protein
MEHPKNEQEKPAHESNTEDVLMVGEAVLDRLRLISRTITERVRELTGESQYKMESPTN